MVTLLDWRGDTFVQTWRHNRTDVVKYLAGVITHLDRRGDKFGQKLRHNRTDLVRLLGRCDDTVGQTC